MAAFRVTDSSGASAVTTHQVVISPAAYTSPWPVASGIVAVLLVLVLAWLFVARRKRRRAEERRRKEAELEEGKAFDAVPATEDELEADLALLEAEARKEEDEITEFEEIEEEPEPPVEDLEMEPEFDMTPYPSQLLDKGQEGDVDAEETEISTVAAGPVDTDAAPKRPVVEKTEAEEKAELDDLLAGLTEKAEAAEKADLKVKKAEADLGAEDTEGEISIRPRKKSRKIKRPVPTKVEKPGVSKDADSDIGAEDTSPEIQEFMDILRQVEEKDKRKKKP
jgi:hypothetical protein